MNVILLSGGSGKRLWPLSNDVRSKQFLKLFRAENGEYESMLQRVYRQLKTVDAQAKITIATAKTQVGEIREQLGNDVGICAEPCRRDTFPAIALATAYLKDVLGVNDEESVIVCPVDPYVESDYFATLKQLCGQAEEGVANLNLMGIEPTYPSEKYGYILPKTTDEISEVESFKEKPTAIKAEEYIAQGALWNGGVFAYKLSYVTKKAKELFGFSDYQSIYENYENLKKISFDYAVVEHEESIKVMRYRGEWKDVGTWNTLTETMSEQYIGKALASESCENVHIVNELNIPILAVGLKNIVISASPEGIIVSDKEQSAYIKPLVDKIQE